MSLKLLIPCFQRLSWHCNLHNNNKEGLKDEETGILNKVLQASNQEEVIYKDLREREREKRRERERERERERIICILWTPGRLAVT